LLLIKTTTLLCPLCLVRSASDGFVPSHSGDIDYDLLGQGPYDNMS